METIQDLYKEILHLLKVEQKNPISLETYLKNLINQAGKFSHKEAMTIDEFYGVLQSSFKTEQTLAKKLNKPKVPNFQKWVALVEQQIQDLGDMAANGQLNCEWCYGGINAPSGNRWYNFDPCTYIECGIAGSIERWEKENHTQIYTLGIDADGNAFSSNPHELYASHLRSPYLTWKLLSSFVWYGQNYE